MIRRLLYNGQYIHYFGVADDTSAYVNKEWEVNIVWKNSTGAISTSKYTVKRVVTDAVATVDNHAFETLDAALATNGTSYKIVEDVTATEDITIAVGDTLTIAEGKTLTMPKDKTLTINGALEVDGILNGHDGDFTVEETGLVTGFGLINLSVVDEDLDDSIDGTLFGAGIDATLYHQYTLENILPVGNNIEVHQVNEALELYEGDEGIDIITSGGDDDIWEKTQTYNISDDRDYSILLKNGHNATIHVTPNEGDSLQIDIEFNMSEPPICTSAEQIISELASGTDLITISSDDEIVINDDIEVAEDQRLIIDSETTVSIAEGKTLTVNGTLIVNGTLNVNGTLDIGGTVVGSGFIELTIDGMALPNATPALFGNDVPNTYREYTLENILPIGNNVEVQQVNDALELYYPTDSNISEWVDGQGDNTYKKTKKYDITIEDRDYVILLEENRMGASVIVIPEGECALEIHVEHRGD